MSARKILSIDDLSDGDISRLFFKARSSSLLNGSQNSHNRVLITAFFEPSTRTRLSFAMAALQLGFRVLDFNQESSSMKKGESFKESILTLINLGASLLVTRSDEALDQDFIRTLALPIINGGDGINEHPSQALLDCFTLLNTFGTDDLFNKNILIVGDIAHSRVARSNIKLMKRLGARLSLLVPPCLEEPAIDHGIAKYPNYSSLAGNFDAVMMLRIQKERLKSSFFFSDQEYYENFGLDQKRFISLGPQCLLLHPGPMNIGVEISENVAYHPRSLIHKQVHNGVLVRAALIDFCF